MAEPTPVPAADLLAKLNAAGVEVIHDGCPLIYTERWGFRRQAEHTTFRVWDADARNAVTVAALEVVHGAGAYLVPPNRWAGGAWWVSTLDGRTIKLDAPDLAEAAVEAACRVRGEADR